MFLFSGLGLDTVILILFIGVVVRVCNIGALTLRSSLQSTSINR